MFKDRVRAMFTEATFTVTRELTQEFDLLELTIDRSDAVQPALGPAVDDDVQTVERIKQSLSHAEWFTFELKIEWFDLDPVGLADRRRRDDEQTFVVLIADDEFAVRERAHSHPRTFLVLGYGVDQFHLKPLGHLQLIDGCCRDLFTLDLGLSVGHGNKE